MFRALGLHYGPDISVAAAAAAAGVPVRTARRALDILLGAFLIEAVRPGRYQLHDLLRAYALDQARTVDSDSERRETLDRILRWYIVTASQACLLLSPGDRFEIDVPSANGPDAAVFDSTAAAFEWFDTERPNLVANVRSALASGLARRAWELAMVLSPIHMHYFTFDDWSVLSEIAVTAAEEVGDPAALASALDNRGKFLFRRRLLDDAKVMHSRALSIRENIGDRRGICESLNALGLISLRTRDHLDASVYFENTAVTAQAISDLRWEGLARSNLAEAQLESGNAAAALDIVAPLPAFFADLQDPASEGNALWLLSWTRRLLGEPAAALVAIHSALLIAENANNRMWEGWWLIEAARVHLDSGDPEEAMRCCRMAASLERQIGDPSREAAALDCAGQVLLAQGNAEGAAAFHLEAAHMHRQLGDSWQEALATVHLAECEDLLGLNDASREHLALAIERMQPFSDSRAAQLRHSLEMRLA
jgi:tetratricopeptide (TPR) repeat protein